MTTQRTTTPARAARRQRLLDRFTELLTTWGSPHADDRAGQLRDVVDELGFVLPAALDDPPAPADQHADPDHRAACKAEIDAAIAAARTRRR